MSDPFGPLMFPWSLVEGGQFPRFCDGSGRRAFTYKDVSTAVIGAKFVAQCNNLEISMRAVPVPIVGTC